jgi:membrane protease YdiL (CAAX protease family)
MTMHLSLTTLMQHLLFVFLLLITPLWDYRDTNRLKRCPDSGRKIRYYKTLCSWLWIAAIMATVAVAWRSLLTISPAPDDATWLLGRLWVRNAFLVLFSIFLALALLPAAIGMWKNLTHQPRTYSTADALQSLSFVLPETRRERRWYVVVCISAGVCEEILFRGFLLQYLHTSPWRLSLTLALALSSIVFGLQHLYLGASGAAQGAVIGFVFALLFLLTGNLLAPIVFHTVSDLRMLTILRPPTE